MAWHTPIRRRLAMGLLGSTPLYDGVGGGRRSLAWQVGNPGAVAALAFTQNELRAKSRDLVRRNAWAAAGVEAFVSNAIGTGIKPQSMVADNALRESIHSLWWDWCEQADTAGLTDFYGLQALACRAMLEGGECLVRLRYRRPEDGLAVGLQLQLLEPEHLPTTLNQELASGNVIRAGIEFDRLGRRAAYHLYRSHPGDGSLAPMSGTGGWGGGLDTVLSVGDTTSSTFAGSITDASGTANGSLTKTGTGTLTLSGANTYTGATTVSDGVLALSKRVALYNGNPAAWTATEA